LLLAIMHAVANRVNPRDTTLVYDFFDGEECVDTYGPRDGLHGSRHYAETIRREDLVRHYLAVIVLDMIGDRDLSVTIPMDTPCPLATALFQIAEEHRVREAFGYFPRGSILDDHRPFQELGIPSIDIIDFQFGPGNSYWHTGEDTMDKLSAASLEIVGNVALELVWRIAEKEGVLGID
ncbi:MAG: Zn-dependent exopeptidase M28, partial [Candidatus Pacebacteria bacterium]|nr:Zn-dependent exopeptidase M28 [Candidatus Paceibacterota bacterium]